MQDLRTVFVERRGLDVLLNLLTDPTKPPDVQKEAAGMHLQMTLPFVMPMIVLKQHAMKLDNLAF